MLWACIDAQRASFTVFFIDLDLSLFLAHSQFPRRDGSEAGCCLKLMQIQFELKNGIRSFYDINIGLEKQQKQHQKHTASNKDQSVHTFGSSKTIVNQKTKRFLLLLSNDFHLWDRNVNTIHLRGLQILHCTQSCLLNSTRY
jgi:hypothetical protein